MNLIPASQGGRCSTDGYLWASPASPIVQSHILSVAVDLATRYDLDGLHLDLVRYSSSNYSSDPATMAAFSQALQITPSLTITAWRPQFQRDQVSDLVARIYSATTAIKPDLLLSAAVWPNYSDGYNGFFQASKDWLAGNYIDANMPMLYTSDILNDLSAWITRTQGFIDDAHGRWIIPGISGAYTETAPLFDRIAAARSMGAPGVAIFSYSGLNAGNFWADLANGPFAIPAIVQPWKPDEESHENRRRNSSDNETSRFDLRSGSFTLTAYGACKVAIKTGGRKISVLIGNGTSVTGCGVGVIVGVGVFVGVDVGVCRRRGRDGGRVRRLRRHIGRADRGDVQNLHVGAVHAAGRNPAFFVGLHAQPFAGAVAADRRHRRSGRLTCQSRDTCPTGLRACPRC